MTTIAYDPTRAALYKPQTRPTLFQAGQPCEPLPLALEAARLAYVQDERELADAMKRVGFGSLRCFDVPATGSQAFGAYRAADGIALLAFRGTQADDPSDLATDADFKLVPWGGATARAHQGFARAALSLQAPIQAWLDTACPGRRGLWMSGHSLGAALATLLATVWRPDLLATLGSPRVGDAGLAALLGGIDSVRVVNCCDTITWVPPEALGYVHIHPPLYIDRDARAHQAPGDEVIDADRWRARLAYAQEHAWRLGTVAVRELADHAPINYLRAFF